MKLSLRRKRSRGSILVMSVFFLIVLFITASAFITLLPIESRSAIKTERIVQGGMAADAGISDALAWLRFQLSQVPSKEPMASGVYPGTTGRTRTLGNGWAYRWELTADAETFPNGNHPIRAYTIVSQAYHNGVGERMARAEVIQESLANYAELFNEWPDNLVKGIRTTSAPVGGPVHSNDEFRFWIPEGSAFWGHAGEAPFSHGVTSTNALSFSQDGFGYYGGNYSGTNSDQVPYNSGGPIASRYARMANGGKDAMKSGQGYIPLPSNTFQIKDGAWGYNTATPLPTSAGVHFNTVNGEVQGIYIKGDVEEMELGVGGSQPAGSGSVAYGTNSWVKIELPINGQRSIEANENVTVVSVESAPVNLPSGVTVNGTVRGSASTVPVGSTLVRRATGVFEVFDNPLNGVVYTDGNIRDLWGVNKGRRTIAVSGDATSGTSHQITIGGKESDSYSNTDQNNATTPLSFAAGQKGLIQHGVSDADGDGILDAPTTSDNVLGLVAGNVMVSRRLRDNGNWNSAHTQSNPLYLYATVLGGLSNGGGTYAVESYDSGGGGWTYKYGSRIMVNAGAWGTTSGHGLVNGTTFFDAPASENPPPLFPAQPTFAIKSYEEIPLVGGSL